MTDTPGQDVKASINQELETHYRRHVDAYRPDLKEDIPPGDPIFHPLNPCHLRQEREVDRRQYSVPSLLTTRLQDTDELPRRVLVLGRRESGKTALFALILHYWLHGKDKMEGLSDFDFLLAIQCLGLESKSLGGQTAVDLEQHMLDHLPHTIQEHGLEVVRQTLRSARVLVMIDSLECLEDSVLDEATSLAPWTDSRVLLFCRYQYMKERPNNPFYCDQSKDNLVLKLWGGIIVNLFHVTGNTPENIAEFGGVFSGQLLKDYCKRLCQYKNMDSDKFQIFYNDILQYLSFDMRKPFNIYMAMEAFSNHQTFNPKIPSELYSKWFDIWSKVYLKNHPSDSNTKDITIEGASFLTTLADKAFTEGKIYISHEDSHEKPEMIPFLKHFLMPHYNPRGTIEKFTFRLDAHKLFLVAKQLDTKIDLGKISVKDALRSEHFKALQSLLPMVLGVARGSNYYEDIKVQALKIAELNLEDHITSQFGDPIINYAVTLLSETKLFSEQKHEYNPFVRGLIECLRPNNWSLTDGNIHPEALKTLCECGHDNKEPKPQRLNILLYGLPEDMPGLHNVLEVVKGCDMRIIFNNDCSFLDKTGAFPFDKAISALHGKGGASLTTKRGASLASFSGYLNNVKMLDRDPTTRRIYKISLRICSQTNYEELREICKVSHKLQQVTLRISHDVKFNAKKLKELPSGVAKLTVILEDFTDEHVEQAIMIWRSIQGTAQRKDEELRFWVTEGHGTMSPSSIRKVVCADLPGSRIELSLKQPVSSLDIEHLQKELNKLKEDKYLIRLLGSSDYTRRDLRKNN